MSQPWAKRYKYTPNVYKDLWDRGMAIIEREKNNPNVFILDQTKFRENPKKEMDKLAKFLGIENKFDVSSVKPL